MGGHTATAFDGARSEGVGPSAPCKTCEQRSRRVLESAADAYLLCEQSGRIRDVNAVACKSLGYSRAELLALSARDIVVDFDALERTASWESMLPGECLTFRVMHRRKDGSTFPVETLLTRLRHDDERLWIALARDVSEQQSVLATLEAARRKAEQANELKSLQLASTTHEIRTPMNAVIGLTDLLLTTSLTPQQRRYAETIRSSGNLLLKIIDDILDYSALEAGRLALGSDACNIESVIERSLEMLAESAYSKGVELACVFRTSVVHFVGDQDRLRQIVLNLVSNAIKFTAAGEVVVDVSSDADADGRQWLRVGVEDSGIGIAATRSDEVFHPFTRLHGRGGQAPTGSGMGLAISKQLVELMGGEIGIGPRAHGGTAAWFRIPVAPLALDTAGRTDESTRGIGALVVHCNRAVAESAAHALTTAGMRAVVETDAAHALERLRAADAAYDLVVVDAEMPGMDAACLVERLRAAGDAKIVLLTSVLRPIEPVDDPRVHCLTKPVLPRPLRRVAKDALSGRERRAQPRHGRALGNVRTDAKILVAEDNPIGQSVLVDMLRVLGLDADVVSNGHAALEAARRDDYRLILLDCLMPDMDGYEVTERIRRRSVSGTRPAIVAVTANASVDERARCLRAGMDDFVAKPVTLETLRLTLRRWLEQASGPAARPAARPRALGTVPSRGDLAGPDLRSFFAADAERRIEEITKLLDSARDGRTALRRAVHSLKGGCLHVGADSMTELCDRFDASVADGDLEAGDAILGELGLELARTASCSTDGMPR